MKLGGLCLLCLLLSTITAAKTYVVGAQNIEYFPHYDFDSPIDKGIGWAILEAFSKESDHQFIYSTMPIRRLQMEMRKGHVDFVYPDNPGWYNEITNTKQKYFSLPFTHAVTGTFVKPENVNKGVNSITRIAMPLGFTPVNWQQRIDKNLTKITTISDTYAGLALLQLERVDALDLEYHVSRYYTDRLPQLGPFALDITLPHNEIPFMLSTLRHRDIIEQLNAFLQNNPDLINKIKTRYKITTLEAITDTMTDKYAIDKHDIWHSP